MMTTTWAPCAFPARAALDPDRCFDRRLRDGRAFPDRRPVPIPSSDPLGSDPSTLLPPQSASRRAELGDVDAITAILNKEKNDGDFNPVRRDGALFFSRRSSDDPELGEKNPRSDPT